MTAPSNANTSGLAPCPFCGGEAWLNDYEAKYSDLPPKSRAPQCRSCGASLGYLTTPAKATEAWNRRVTAAPASPLPGGVWRTDFENAPDCEEGILIVDATKISPAVGTARFIDGEWCGYDHGHGVECLWPSPTHWMPLPAAPTGEPK